MSPRNGPKKGKRLVIVESPAKARTIQRYLGEGYDVAASVGHIRDLPPKELGVDVDQGFEPKYVTIHGKGKIITDLKRKAKDVVEVLLATDPDREGEAIAYHVAEQLGDPTDSARFRRIQFHEITRDAVRHALESAGTLDMKKVEAQQARRILDRLVGYQVSPFLWKPIFPGLSAGRVQTVALRVIWEREEEIRAFRSQEYWSLTARLNKDGQDFDAKLHHTDGKAVHLGNESQTNAVLADVQDADFPVAEVKRRERRKNPAAPFTTSTLQQEAAKRMRFSARRTMTTAQRLYEGVELGDRGAVGLITYMRTDSTRVAGVAVEQARGWIAGEMGKQFVSGAPRYWTEKKQKGAQEAHEAIRPTDVTIHPTEVYQHLDEDQARLYEVVWLRFVASQMAPAVYDTTTADFDVRGEEQCARTSVSGNRLSGEVRGLHAPLLGGRGSRGSPPARRSGAPAAAGRRRPFFLGWWGGHGGRSGCGASGRSEAALHPAASPLQRGQPGEGARGAGNRQAVDLRPDHLDPPGPKLR